MKSTQITCQLGWKNPRVYFDTSYSIVTINSRVPFLSRLLSPGFSAFACTASHEELLSPHLRGNHGQNKTRDLIGLGERHEWRNQQQSSACANHHYEDFHSHPQSCDPFGQRHGSRPLAGVPARGLDPWRWPQGSRPLGTRMEDFLKNLSLCRIKDILKGGSQQFFWPWSVSFEVKISQRRWTSISLLLHHLFNKWSKFIFLLVS